jgi:MarR family transcriptional regulator, organic hydroperoxide resistance regulator
MTSEPESPASTVDALAVEDERGLQLGQQLCFAVHVAARAYDGVYRRVLADFGLTYPQYLVMLVLWEHGDLPVKRLGELMRLDSGTLSPLLKRMEAAGLVVRERGPDDERSVTVMLTEKGRTLKDRARGVPLKVHGATGLTVDELIDLRTRLERLSAALDDSAGRD